MCLSGAPTTKRGPCSVSAFAIGTVKRDKARARIAAPINRIFLITLQKLFLLISRRTDWLCARYLLGDLSLNAVDSQQLRHRNRRL